MYKLLSKLTVFLKMVCFKYLFLIGIIIFILYSAFMRISLLSSLSSKKQLKDNGRFGINGNILKRDRRRQQRRPSVYYGYPGFYRG